VLRGGIVNKKYVSYKNFDDIFTEEAKKEDLLQFRHH
jgi:hypothetical protein